MDHPLDALRDEKRPIYNVMLVMKKSFSKILETIQFSRKVSFFKWNVGNITIFQYIENIIEIQELPSKTRENFNFWQKWANFNKVFNETLLQPEMISGRILKKFF